MKLIKSKVAEKILSKLNSLSNRDNIVKLNSYQIERHLIPNGKGMLSASRYIRLMREMGLIDYEDPRKYKHTYIIKLNKSKIKKILKKIKYNKEAKWK